MVQKALVDETNGVIWMQAAHTAWNRLTALGQWDMHVQGISGFFYAMYEYYGQGNDQQGVRFI